MGEAGDQTQTAESELDHLLGEAVDAARRRQRTTFDRLAAPHGASLVLFGAGDVGRKTLRGLRQIGIEPLALTGDDPAQWGRSVAGLTVLSPPEAARRFGRRAVFVVALWRPRHAYLQRRQQLAALGCSRVATFAALFWKYPDLFLPHYSIDSPTRLLERAANVRKAFALMADEESRRQYVAHIRWRLWLDFDSLPAPAWDQYFPARLLSLCPDEVFVDGGAWRGDTIRKFLARQGPAFRRMHAFEPDPHNFRELTASLSTLAPDLGAKIAAYRCALGARPGPVRFQAHGSAGSRVGSEGSAEVECVTLDAQLRDETPTYLKLDVEGAEADALAGGQEVIRRARPIVAVSVYHRPADLWELPLYLHSLYAGYRFYLRTHDHDGTEVVCYALPPQRLPGREERLADV